MKIRVENRHIAGGLAAEPCRCAVALAVKEAVGPDTTVCVGPFRTRVGMTFVDTPPHVREWMRIFDGGHPVGPIEFELILPEVVTRGEACASA